MKSQTQNDPWLVQLFRNTIGAGLEWFFARLFWHWPKAGATRIGRQAIRDPFLALLVVVFAVCIPQLIRIGIERDYFGHKVAVAWRNQSVARRNLEITLKQIAAHEKKRPGWIYESYARLSEEKAAQAGRT
jgi:hypothetical protein